MGGPGSGPRKGQRRGSRGSAVSARKHKVSFRGFKRKMSRPAKSRSPRFGFKGTTKGGLARYTI